MTNFLGVFGHKKIKNTSNFRAQFQQYYVFSNILVSTLHIYVKATYFHRISFTDMIQLAKRQTIFNSKNRARRAFNGHQIVIKILQNKRELVQKHIKNSIIMHNG